MNLNEIAFSSEFRYEYIDIKGDTAFTTNGGSPNNASVTITHNLGYIPFFRVYFLFNGDTNYYAAFNGPGLVLGNWQINSINASSTTLSISITNLAGPATGGIVYYRIYAEPQA